MWYWAILDHVNKGTIVGMSKKIAEVWVLVPWRHHWTDYSCTVTEYKHISRC